MVTTTYLTMQSIIAKQEHYSHVLYVAGQQSGLSNRIAHFAGQMAVSEDEDAYGTTRSQLCRAVNKMAAAHDAVLTGNAEMGMPKIITPLLDIIYFADAVGLDPAVKRFLGHARDIYAL